MRGIAGLALEQPGCERGRQIEDLVADRNPGARSVCHCGTRENGRF